MKSRIIFLSIFFLITSQLYSQNYTDALRYSQTYFNGTARSMSMAGAFSSLGGDFFSIGQNPAGLAVYRSSEFTVSPCIQYNKSKSNFSGNTFSDFEYDLGLSNIGIVGTFNSGKQNGWISTSLAFGYNRLNNFDFNTTMKRDKATSSLLDQFVDDANNNIWYYTGNELALESDLIYLDSTNNYYRSDFSGSDYGQSQRRTIETSGSSGEYVFALASNFDNKVYVGGEIGVQTVYYKEHFNHIEDNIPDEIPYIYSFNYEQDLKTTGTGVNFKFGALIKPVDFIRISGAIHSPTFFNLTDTYYNRIDASLTFDNGGPYTNSGKNDYELTTPLKAVAGIGIVVGKLAILSLDYEFVDYTTMRLRNSGDGYDFDTENTYIQENFTTASNVKAGAELRFGAISLRGGYAFYGSPFSSGELNKDASQSFMTGGFGINNNNFYLDFAYVYSLDSQKYVLYSTSTEVVQSNLDFNSNKIVATFGFRF